MEEKAAEAENNEEVMGNKSVAQHFVPFTGFGTIFNRENHLLRRILWALVLAAVYIGAIIQVFKEENQRNSSLKLQGDFNVIEGVQPRLRVRVERNTRTPQRRDERFSSISRRHIVQSKYVQYESHERTEIGQSQARRCHRSKIQQQTLAVFT